MLQSSSFIVVQGLINGLSLACIYILIALGITLILSIMNILQFAHGEIYMIGAFATYYFIVYHNVNAFLAIFLAMIVTGVLGLFLERFVFRRLHGEFLPVICVATGLMLILQMLVVLGFGQDVKRIPSIWPGTLCILDWKLPFDKLAAVLVSVALTLFLFYFLKYSKFGQAIVATAQHREGALAQGINPNLMYAMVMVIGCVLAGVAGGFTGSIFILDPFMGISALMKGITIIVIGGMGSIVGVIVGGVILGLMDGIIPIVFGSMASALVPLVLVVLILIIRPQGLFGRE